MKFIIPAKTGSTRCKYKNWRSFHGNQSLVDVLIEKLLRVADAEDVFLSVNDGLMLTDTPTQRLIPKTRFGIGGFVRPDRLAKNDTPMSEVVRWHAENIPGDDDIAWCQVTNPLFDEYEKVLGYWGGAKSCGRDSLSVIYQINGYVLDGHYEPQGFGFGAFQLPTQDIPPQYRWPCTLNIATRQTALTHGYIGPGCEWHEASGPFIDIKTEADFEAAQVLYAAKMEKVVA